MTNKDLETLANKAMINLMKLKCKEHVYEGMLFFSQSEFEKNQYEIFEITGAHRRLGDKLKKLEKNET